MEDIKVKEAIAKIEQQTKDLIDKVQVQDLIKNNVAEFEITSIKYRTSKPNFKQKLELNSIRSKKYAEMLRNPENLMEKDLIAVYKTRGIDIEEMNSKFEALEASKKNLADRLGRGITENKSEEELQALRLEIEKIMSAQEEIILTKIVLLDSSIESQISVFGFIYLAYLVTEKLVNDMWVKAWDTYEEFIQQDEEVVNTVVYYATFLSRNEVSVK